MSPTPHTQRRPAHPHLRHLTLAGRIAHHWKPRRTRMRGLLAFLGPGLITGASDDDPSGIATYSQVGAQFGYAMCWVMLFTWPLMAAIQEISARIGRVTGEGIAGNIREHYSRPLLLIIVALLLAANTINLGADLGAMGAALQLLLPGSAHLYVVGFASICALLEVFVTLREICPHSEMDGGVAVCLRRDGIGGRRPLGPGRLSYLCTASCLETRITWSRLSRCSARRSRPTASSGNPRRRPRTSRSTPRHTG